MTASQIAVHRFPTIRIAFSSFSRLLLPSLCLLLLLLLLLAALCPSSSAEAATVRGKAVSVPSLRVAEGIVTGMNGTVVRVRTRDYDMKNVPIRTPSGHVRGIENLYGQKVEIFIRDGRIDAVLLYDSMIE